MESDVFGPAGLRAREIASAVRGGRLRAADLCRRTIDAARGLGEALGAFNSVLADSAMACAQEIDRRVVSGEDPGPLAGVPLAIKDNICTRGSRTTCSSRILEDFVPPYDATAVTRLRAAGGVIVAKTNMDEFAMGSSNENSAFRLCRNPWDIERVPGGSSGGSAAAVASGIVPAALGSETGGSVRQPASLCGIVGVKPTYGRVSRYGLVAFASSLDQIGVLAADVADAALILSIIAGHDPLDSTSAPEPVEPYVSLLSGDLRSVTFGLPDEYFVSGMDPEVERLVKGAVERIGGAGGRIVPVSLPHTRFAIPTYYLIATAEASSNLARYDGVRYGLREPSRTLEEMYRRTRSAGFGAEVRRRIMLGTYVLSAGYYDAYYLKAQKVRTLLRRDFEEAFRKSDIILTPTSPTPAFRLGEKTEAPLEMYLSDIFTATANLAGLPAISIPCGLASGRLPVGLQLIGDHFQEPALFKAAAAVEALLGPTGMRPPLAAT
ncbi:MAG: Asp-tRNA(Asn)/Glu-tRNA(Gln) amidotransferase GatCAB subunit A [Acidobacteria bacterium]|nr:MAG: Asp-tRNA(Asn)/Glu-tRNA(Gln) amidotransferase GatCAB subunit A [Acidobacteriota bacterium]